MESYQLKFITLILAITLCISCSNNTALSSNDSEEKIMIESEASIEAVDEAITLAVSKKDYRLLATSTRGINIPGVHSEKYQAMIELCGKKYQTMSGDVITSENQRMERKNLMSYMRQYNKKILIICQEVNKK